MVCYDLTFGHAGAGGYLKVRVSTPRTLAARNMATLIDTAIKLIVDQSQDTQLDAGGP